MIDERHGTLGVVRKQNIANIARSIAIGIRVHSSSHSKEIPKPIHSQLRNMNIPFSASHLNMIFHLRDELVILTSTWSSVGGSFFRPCDHHREHGAPKRPHHANARNRLFLRHANDARATRGVDRSPPMGNHARPATPIQCATSVRSFAGALFISMHFNGSPVTRRRGP